jgi:hypothetical protein
MANGFGEALKDGPEMRTFIALIDAVHLIEPGVALAPTVQSELD